MLKLFFKKDAKKFTGLLTLAVYDINGNVIESKSLRNIKCRSGKSNWFWNPRVVGDDPVPDGELFLWNKKSKILQYNELDAKGGGIGRFYPISDSLKQSTTISVNTSVPRNHIGLHDENDYVGSSGCIVVIDNKDFLKVCRLLEEFEGSVHTLSVWSE